MGSSLFAASNNFFTCVCESFCVREERDQKKRGEKSPLERERVERFSSLSLLPPFPEEKDDDASDKQRRTRRRCFYFSPSFHTPRARAGAFSFTQKQRADWISIISKNRDREDAFFSKSRARKSRGERERETIERARETRTRATHRKETTASMGPLRSPLKSPCLCVFVLCLSVFWHFFL